MDLIKEWDSCFDLLMNSDSTRMPFVQNRILLLIARILIEEHNLK